jgi:hypothetical protein
MVKTIRSQIDAPPDRVSTHPRRRTACGTSG